MAQTYKQIQKQIEQLQRQAEALREGEIKGVIDRIKVAIAHYGLTAAHLGLEAIVKPSRKPAGARRATKKAGAAPVFRDGEGNVWSGRGPRPRWLKAALETGRSIEDFRVAAGSDASKGDGAAKASRTAAPVRRPRKKKPA